MERKWNGSGGDMCYPSPDIAFAWGNTLGSHCMAFNGMEWFCFGLLDDGWQGNEEILPSQSQSWLSFRALNA